ncbi:MAG: GNAT family N-acetyltransferase [Candidatus Kapaibacterium sp.]
MSDFNIRIAESKDKDKIKEFNLALARETEDMMLDESAVAEGVTALLRNKQLGFYLVAEKDGEIVASLMVTTEWSDWRNGLFWWIQSVYVVPQHRREGIYRDMYDKVKDLAKDMPDVIGFRLYVEKDNLQAQKTYTALGMAETFYKIYEEII